MSVVEYGWRRTAIVVAVMLAILLQLADTNIVNVALPTIDGALGASPDEGTWLVTSYIIANVIVIPLSPWLQATLGRRTYFIASIGGFTLFSVFCGLAGDLNTEIVLRFLQGAFGGGLMVSAQQILRDTYPPHELAKSQGLFGLAVPIGPAIGPVLGGVLTDSFSWQWIFFVNLVPGLVALALIALVLRNPEPPKKMAVDGVGIAFLAFGLGSMQYVLERGERLDWFSDGSIVIGTIAAVVCIALFLWWELRVVKHPAVNLPVMKQRAVWAMTLTFFGLGFAFYGMFIMQPVYTQETLGFTTTLSGEFMMVRAAALAAAYPLTTWLGSKNNIDLRFVVAFGISSYALTWFWQAQQMTSTADFDTFMFSQIVAGLTLGLAYMPLNVLLMRAIEPSTVASSLALVRLGMQIGGSVGAAAMVTFLDRSAVAAATTLQGSATLANPAVHNLIMQHGHRAVLLLSEMVSAQANDIAQAGAARMLGVVLLLCTPLPLLLRKHKPAKTVAVSPVHTPPISSNERALSRVAVGAGRE